MNWLFDFYKTPLNKWYIHLPTYPGPIEDLQMIQGADAMLDKLSNNKDKITVYVSDTQKPSSAYDTYVLKLIAVGENDSEGAWYDFKGDRVWLCAVTIFVFENYPETIYIKVI